MRKKVRLLLLNQRLQLHPTGMIKKYPFSRFYKTLAYCKKFFLINHKFRRITTPNTTRQIINNFKPFEQKYFNKKSIANNENKNVEKSPTIRGKKLNEENSLIEEMNSTIAAKEIAGMPKKKENFAASRLSQPDTKALEIVTPDLETPGQIARA